MPFPFSAAETELIVKLCAEGKTPTEIHGYFAERSMGSIYQKLLKLRAAGQIEDRTVPKRPAFLRAGVHTRDQDSRPPAPIGDFREGG